MPKNPPASSVRFACFNLETGALISAQPRTLAKVNPALIVYILMNKQVCLLAIYITYVQSWIHFIMYYNLKPQLFTTLSVELLVCGGGGGEGAFEY